MKRLALALSALLVAGCPAEPRRVTETVVVPVEGDAPTPRERATVTSPSAKCRIVEDEWSERDGPLPLRFEPGAPPFANISAAALDLRVEWATKVHVRALAISGGLTIAGTVAPADVVLFAKRPIAFRGILIPGPHHVLRLAPPSASPELRVRCDYDPGAHLDHPVACADLGLLPGEYDPFAGRIDDSTATGYAIDVDVLEVSPARDAPSVARFTSDDGAELFVLERRGDRARILWPRGDDVVIGWVDTAAVGQPLGGRIGRPFGIGHGAGGYGLIGVLAGPATRCPHPLVLQAMVDGRRRAVGTIAPDTPLDLYDDVDGYTLLDVRQSGIGAAEGASFLVESSALTDCRQP